METQSPCQVLLNDNGCLAPAGGSKSARTECFACGGQCCTNCSTRREYLSFGKRRVCNDCVEQLAQDDTVRAEATKDARTNPTAMAGARC